MAGDVIAAASVTGTGTGTGLGSLGGRTVVVGALLGKPRVRAYSVLRSGQWAVGSAREEEAWGADE
jgi:hypothetical protein